MLKVRGHDLNYLISQLTKFNSEYNSANKSIYRYILLGESIHPLKTIIRHPKRLAKLILRKRNMPVIIRLPFCCNSIRIKNNLRIFGYGSNSNFSVKIAVASSYRKGSLFREIKARKILSNYQLDFMPKIIKYDRNGKWVVDELLLEPKTTTKANKAQEFIYYYALPFYSATSRLHPLHKSFRRETIKDMPEIIFKNIDFNHRWPVALCHGDLSPGNMVRHNNGQLYVVDWESSGVKAVAYDVSKIYTDFPELRIKVLDLLKEISYEQGIDPKHQIGLALANKLSNIEQGRLVKYNLDRGLSKQDAIKKKNDSVSMYQNLLSELF